MDEMIAYPLELLNDTAIEEHYKNVSDSLTHPKFLSS